MKNSNTTPLKEQSAIPKKTAEFLQHFLLDGLGALINEPGQPFLKFLPLISGIEFLGACYHEFPFDKQYDSQTKYISSLWTK